MDRLVIGRHRRASPGWCSGIPISRWRLRATHLKQGCAPGHTRFAPPSILVRQRVAPPARPCVASPQQAGANRRPCAFSHNAFRIAQEAPRRSRQQFRNCPKGIVDADWNTDPRASRRDGDRPAQQAARHYNAGADHARGLLALAPGPVFAACTVAGTGAIGALNSGDVATCTGLGNTDHINATGGSNVTVNIGDGTLTSLLPGAGIPAIVYDGTSNSNVTINNRPRSPPTAEPSSCPTARTTTTSRSRPVRLRKGTGNAEAAIVIDNSNGNLVHVRGIRGRHRRNRDRAPDQRNVDRERRQCLSRADPSAAAIPACSSLPAATPSSMPARSPAASSSPSRALPAPTPSLNSGTISGGGSGAIDLFGGDDVLALAPGSTITGFVCAAAPAPTR